MGLFTQRPEENDEWAGLPSEPHQSESLAERLPDAAPTNAMAVGLGDYDSIAIPLTVAVEIEQSPPIDE
jgi:hypothetical protein